MSAYSSINLEILNTSLDFYLGHFYINVEEKLKTKTQMVRFLNFFCKTALIFACRWAARDPCRIMDLEGMVCRLQSCFKKRGTVTFSLLYQPSTVYYTVVTHTRDRINYHNKLFSAPSCINADITGFC